MAPLSMGDDPINMIYHLRFLRSIGNTSSGMVQVVTASEGYTLQCLALAFSTASVASAILSFYWFIKMRRSFRHDLIMLLIQSDMFKALWLMLYPIVTFIYGPIPNEAKFCQVQGFFLSLGIEASDFAILMIAIHTALYIFKPRTSGEGGLYPYRRFAYVLWVLFPVLMASLAFINDDFGYVSDGTYCYLPVRPFWYQLALAWIPRYIIFIVILGIYISIYCYVRYKFNGFSKGENDSNGSGYNKDPVTKPPRAAKRFSLPPTSQLAPHELISGSRQSSFAETPFAENRGRRKSVSSPISEAHRFMWTSFISQTDSPIVPLTPPSTPPSESSTLVADSPAGPISPQPAHHHTLSISFEPPMVPSHQDSANKPSSPPRQTSCQENTINPNAGSHGESSSSRPSIVNIMSVLYHKPGSTQATTPISRLELVNSRGQNIAVCEMMRTREKIRRQLRFLFIYPLVYMGMWLVPFVSHVMQYTDLFANGPPFPLNCLTTIFVASQAAVDCWLFSTREKPWRHIPGNETDRNFWGSLKFWSGWKEIRARRKQATHPGPGKTRQEMAREARQAYKRRDEEMAQRRTDSGHLETSGVKRERSWWEGRSTDGVGDPDLMTPVAEEIGNPMDNVVLPRANGAASSEKLSPKQVNGTDDEGEGEGGGDRNEETK